MITLGREVELFWKGRLTGAAVLFFFNRYLSLVVDVYGLLENMHVPDKVLPELLSCVRYRAHMIMVNVCDADVSLASSTTLLQGGLTDVQLSKCRKVEQGP